MKSPLLPCTVLAMTLLCSCTQTPNRNIVSANWSQQATFVPAAGNRTPEIFIDYSYPEEAGTTYTWVYGFTPEITSTCNFFPNELSTIPYGHQNNVVTLWYLAGHGNCAVGQSFTVTVRNNSAAASKAILNPDGSPGFNYFIADNSNPYTITFTAVAAPSPSPSPDPSAAPSGLTYSNETATYALATAITANNPTLTAGESATYTVSPALPSGLAINASTGVISGTPTKLASAANYTVTATNTQGSTTRTLSIGVNCMSGYARVPHDSGNVYSAEDFCVAKYVASQGTGSVAQSVAGQTPWVNVNKADAQTACRANGIGYDLVSNSEWQTLARNIEQVASNWSSGTVGSGEINTGNSTGSSAIAAASSDNSSCDGINIGGDSCDLTHWHARRRTFALSNGEILWDISGNVRQWVADTSSTDLGATAQVSQITDTSHSTVATVGGISGTAKKLFGPAGDHTSLSTSPWGGLGRNYFGANPGILRGSGYSSGNTDSGIFSTLFQTVTSTTDRYGFRCVYRPTKKMFLTAATINGNAIGGIAAADAGCGTDANKPAGGATYKALLVDGTTRVACTTANCGGGSAEQVDWVLAANTTYLRPDGTVIGTTNSTALLAFPLSASIDTDTTHNAWVGLNADWTTANNHCVGWTTGGGSGSVGERDGTSTNSIRLGDMGCTTNNNSYICVEQ